MFRDEIKCIIDTPVLINDIRSGQFIAMTTFTGCRLLAMHAGQFYIALQIEVTVSQSDCHKVGSVDGQSANH